MTNTMISKTATVTITIVAMSPATYITQSYDEYNELEARGIP